MSWGGGTQPERTRLPPSIPGTERWVMEVLREHGRGARELQLHDVTYRKLRTELDLGTVDKIHTIGPHGFLTIRPSADVQLGAFTVA